MSQDREWTSDLYYRVEACDLVTALVLHVSSGRQNVNWMPSRLLFYLVLRALWSPNGILLLVLRNCASIINPEFFSRPLFGPSVTLSAVASYVRMFPLDLVHLSSFFFTGLKPLLSSSIKSFSYTLDFTFIILTPSSREWVTAGKVISHELEDW